MCKNIYVRVYSYYNKTNYGRQSTLLCKINFENRVQKETFINTRIKSNNNILMLVRSTVNKVYSTFLVFSIGFYATHAYRSMPSKRGCLYLRDRSNPPPHAASMCSHNLYFSQMSAMALMGSKAPSTVVPAVAETKNGI